MDSIKKQLKRIGEQIEKKANGLVSFSDLFPDSFVKQHSNFNSFDELFNHGGFKHETEEEFKAIDETALDDYLKNNTNFNSWQDMQQTAGVEHLKRKLKL